MAPTRSPQHTTTPESAGSFLTVGDLTESDESLRENAQEISIGLYDFLASARRLDECPSARMDTSQSEMEVLYSISTHPGCGVSDIICLRLLRPSNVSAAVRRPPDNGLIKRENDAKDHCTQSLYVSNDGETLLEQFIDHWDVLVYEIVRTMSQKDVHAPIKALSSLLKLAGHPESYVEEHRRCQEPF